MSAWFTNALAGAMQLVAVDDNELFDATPKLNERDSPEFITPVPPDSPHPPPAPVPAPIPRLPSPVAEVVQADEILGEAPAQPEEQAPEDGMVELDLSPESPPMPAPVRTSSAVPACIDSSLIRILTGPECACGGACGGAECLARCWAG